MSMQEYRSLAKKPKMREVKAKLTGYYNSDIPVACKIITSVTHNEKK